MKTCLSCKFFDDKNQLCTANALRKPGLAVSPDQAACDNYQERKPETGNQLLKADRVV